MGRSAIVAGATGLVGGLLLEQLFADSEFTQVTAVTRRSLGHADTKLREIVCDFDQLEHERDKLVAECCFCCLGTTIKKAGSKAAFSKVDHDYPCRLAKTAREKGARHFILVSALGADPQSRVFYNRIKGEVERDIAALDFESFSVARPSLILGKRSEARLGEEVFKRLSPLLNWFLVGRLKKYRAIEASQIARAMIAMAKSESRGMRVYESDELLRM